MKKRYLLTAFAMFFFSFALVLPTYAQDAAPAPDSVPPSPWQFTGHVSTHFNQLHFIDWVPGGQNTISIEGSTLLQLQYKELKHLWITKLELGYGLTKFEKERFVKHMDRIDFSSQYGYEASKMWYYSAFFGIKTQFNQTYKDPKAEELEKISDFCSPLFVTLSLGIDFRPDDHFSALLSPLTGRLTYVKSQMLADKGFFAVKPGYLKDDGQWVPGEHTRWELGAFLKFAYVNRFFNEQLGLNTRLEFFSNYLEKPQNVDIFFDLILDYKLLKFLSAKFQITMMYDDDMKIVNSEGRPVTRLQIREMFGVGLAYHF